MISIILYTKDQGEIDEFLSYMGITYLSAPLTLAVDFDWTGVSDQSAITTIYTFPDSTLNLVEYGKNIKVKTITVEGNSYLTYFSFTTPSTSLDKIEFQADGVDSIIISNTPSGTFTATNLDTGDIVSGSIVDTDSFMSTIKGTYQISIVCEGYEDFNATVEAI